MQQGYLLVGSPQSLRHKQTSSNQLAGIQTVDEEGRSCLPTHPAMLMDKSSRIDSLSKGERKE